MNPVSLLQHLVLLNHTLNILCYLYLTFKILTNKMHEVKYNKTYVFIVF